MGWFPPCTFENNLEQLGFITIVKITKIWRIKANQQNGNFLKSKIVYDLKNFEKEIGRKIQLHLFNRKNVDAHVFNNIAK